MGDDKKLPVVDDSSWVPEGDDQTILSFSDGKNWFFLPAKPYIKLVPAGIAAQLRQQGLFGLPATGHSGSAVVATGNGQALMIDAGSGVARAIYNFQLESVMAQMGVKSITSIEITHGHKDHVNRIKSVILANKILAQNIRIADYQAPYAKLLLQAWRELAAEAAGQQLGYGILRPGHDGFRENLDPNVHYLRVIGEKGELVIEYLARKDSAAKLAQLPKDPGKIVDSAATVLAIGKLGTNFRLIHIGDWRGRDIAAFKEAMEAQQPGSFEAMFRGVEVVSGMQHHLGVVEQASDVVGLADLLEVTALGGSGRLDAVVQTDKNQMRSELVQALTLLGVDVSAALKGTLDVPSNLIVKGDRTITATLGALLQADAGPNRLIRIRLANRENQRLALAHYGKDLQKLGIQLPRSLQEIRDAIDASLRDVRRAYRARAKLILDAVRKGEPIDLERVEQNSREILREREVDRWLKANETADRLVELGRLSRVESDLDREMRLAQLQGRPTERLIELIEFVSPSFAREILEQTPRTPMGNRELWEELLRQEQQLKILNAEVAPKGLGGKTLVGALALTQIANEYLGMVAEIRQAKKLARLNAVDIWTWWVERGVIPPLSGYIYHRLADDELITDTGVALKKVKQDELDAVLIGEIKDPSHWARFNFWCAANIKNFDDYYRHFVTSPVQIIRPTPGMPLVGATWQMHTTSWQGGILGAGQIFEWTPSDALSTIMQATMQRIKDNTNKELAALWVNRTPVGSYHLPIIYDPKQSIPIDAHPRNPVRRVKFKSKEGDDIYNLNERTIVSSASENLNFYEIEASNVPAGYIAVIGADFASYATIELAGGSPVALIKKDAVKDIDIPLMDMSGIHAAPPPMINPSGGLPSDVAPGPPHF